MKHEDRRQALERLGLDQDKVDKMMGRALRACADYRDGKLTLKQVWQRVRGDRFMMAAQFCADEKLGMMLYELSCDFYTEMGERDDIIHQSVLRIVKAMESRPDRPA